MNASAARNSHVKAISPLVPVRLQRKCACGSHSSGGGECGDCRKRREGLHRKGTGPGPAGPGPGVAPPLVHDVLRSPGQPLAAETRAFMEPRFGQDFSRVRVHADARAAESARAVDASAYTVGSHVVFGPGGFHPHTGAGQQLLAHELAHVAQQGAAEPTGSLSISQSGDALERDDERKIHDIIHESTHNALHTTDREYSNSANFNRLRPRGGGTRATRSSPS